VIQVRTQDVLPSAIGIVVLRAIDACHHHLEAGAVVNGGPDTKPDSPIANPIEMRLMNSALGSGASPATGAVADPRR